MEREKVKVTVQRRSEPELRKLARALILLAAQEVDQEAYKQASGEAA
jgi:hypothetical protein